MKSIKSLTAIAATGVVLAFAGQALAHHSAAMFDAKKRVPITGVVKEFRWTNPHGYLQLMVTNSKGREQNWAIEFQSLQGMRGQGLNPNSFKPGDKVDLVIHPLRNGTTGGDFVGGKLADGKVIGDMKTN
jgi:hypothetical protein